MEIALVLVTLAVVILTGTAIAGRIGFPAPLLLVVVGVAASYVPGVPEIRLGPEVVLVGLLPPLLYATAMQTSLVDFRANQRSILLLSVGLVVFTTLGVGAVVHALLPSVGWPAALALGAVVAPPDAVAATAVARRIGLPRRIVTILEGESLLNDATALVALRTAIAATAGGGVDAATSASTSSWRQAAGAVGVLVFLVVAWVRKQVTDPLIDTAISLVVPFAAYVAAEHDRGLRGPRGRGRGTAAGTQGAGAPDRVVADRRADQLAHGRVRPRERGLPAHRAAGALDPRRRRRERRRTWRTSLAVCAATLATVVVLRLAWVFPARYLLVRRAPTGRPGCPPCAYTFLIGWAGMRGVVTLAAAFVIPRATPAPRGAAAGRPSRSWPARSSSRA